MSETYHELTDTKGLKDTSELTIPRAKALADAVQRQRDYSLVQILRYPAEEHITLEYLIVDVECDGVPPKNRFGIQYRERLALCVSDTPKELIQILALRKGFPILMHQNHSVLGAPASLCLYSASASEVMRTWTPQKFLRRIQWWLEKSAQGKLHPADQPVEHLFFASKFELVLPWNFADLSNNSALRYAVIQQQERSNGGITYFLMPISEKFTQQKHIKKPPTARHVILSLPPVVHGSIEQDPATLGQLADLLTQRGVNLIAPLRKELQESVDEKGTVPSTNDKGTIIILSIPICRSADTAPDGIAHRAFLVPISTNELGIACGALVKSEHDKRYYNDLFNPQPSEAWRNQPILPMEVLKQNSGAEAMHQSGIKEEGPTGVVVGAGSLGSALLNIWGRSGWGHWTVIDKDHIRPHNLSRHTAYAWQIGMTKATVVADLHTNVMSGATEIVPVVADACSFKQDDVAKAFAGATLVIDASTTLEYPRDASVVDTLPRQFSVFLTPDGNAAVLLAEDAKRVQRLRTLEAQYYRALIQRDWGKYHFDEQIRSFRSGASCRDISFIMPYSRILSQASTLAEQVQAASICEDALIRMWRRDPVRGGINAHDVTVMPERRFPFGEIDLYIDDGIEKQLRELRQQSLPNETGGVLLGYYDQIIRAVIVVAGLPAPPDSKTNPKFFERGIDGLADAVKDAAARTAGIVGYIGEWHSHPPDYSASPSQDDLVQLTRLALGMDDDGLPAVQIIVGEAGLQVLQANVDRNVISISIG